MLASLNAISAISTVCILVMFVYLPTPLTFAQVPDTSEYGVKIIYPIDGQEVPVGEHAMFGTASYNVTFGDCTVYADLNDLEPMQKVMPARPNYTDFGRTDDDYSTWIFAYTNKYHSISEGENELTAKLSCDIGPFNFTRFDSVNVTGISSGD
jgi:hypothetical protein